LQFLRAKASIDSYTAY